MCGKRGHSRGFGGLSSCELREGIGWANKFGEGLEAGVGTKNGRNGGVGGSCAQEVTAAIIEWAV